MSALDMVMQRQVPTRTAGKSSELGASSNMGGESGKEPFADILSGQQRAATAKPGRAEGSRDDAPVAEPEDLEGAQSDPEAQDMMSGTGDSDDVLALLNDLMSSAAYGNEARIGAPANRDAEPSAAGEDVAKNAVSGAGADDALSGVPGQKTPDPLTALQSGDAAVRPGSKQPESRGRELQADGAEARAAGLPTGPGAGQGAGQGAGLAQAQTTSKLPPDAGRTPAAAKVQPAADYNSRERTKPTEAKEALRSLGLDGQAVQGKTADAKTRVDQRKAEPPARIASGTSRQPEEKLEKSSRNVEVLESRRFVAGQQLGGNAQMLARSIMDTGDTALATARAGPAQTSAAPVQQQSVQTLHTLKLQLNPASLGNVTAVLKLSGEELHVDIKVETAEAYRQLSDDHQGLLKALRSQGYGVEQINIQHVAGGDRAQNQQAGAQPGFQGPGSNDAQSPDRDAGNGRNSGGKSDGDNGRQSRESNSHPASGGNGRTDGVYL